MHPSALPRRLYSGDPALPDTLTLIRAGFAVMDGLIDPPSSVRCLTLADLTAPPSQAWALGEPVIACIVLTPRPGVLYLGKIVVDPGHRGRGLARSLIAGAENCARAMGLPVLELRVRVELVHNQAAFTALGFAETGRTAHPGHDRPTSITYARSVPG